MTTKCFNQAMMATIFSSGLACLAVQSAHAATLIHNGGFTEDSILLPNHPGYGSNVDASNASMDAFAGAHGIVGTPDIALTWIGDGGTLGEFNPPGVGFETFTNWDTPRNAGANANVIQLDSSNDGSRKFQIVFTPQNNAAVRVNSFDLDFWSGGEFMEVTWRIEGAFSGVLANGSYALDTGNDWQANLGGRRTFQPNATGVAGETLTLHIEHLQGSSSYLALDNLAFDQLVPEPASAMLVAAGVGAMAMRRRREA